MSARRRIAIVSRIVAGVTGATTIILEQSRRFSEAGWDVHVFGEKLDAGRLAAVGAQPHFITRWPVGSYFKRRLFAWLFERELRSEPFFDIVNGHGDTFRQDVLSIHNCVHAAHESIHGRPLPAASSVGRIHRRTLEEKRFKLLVANSALSKRDVVKRYALTPERAVVIHPGHDPERFNPEDRVRLGTPVRQKIGARPGDLVVGLITSGDFVKRGVDKFLAALGRLPAELRTRLRVLVIGRETSLDPYLETAQSAGIGDRITFLQPDPEVEKYYHALDLYVHPAIFEEFGLSVQEAMACGVAVLTSRQVGASELVPDTIRDSLLERPTVEGLANGMAGLLSDEETRRLFAREGREAVRANTWDANFKRTLECYEGLLSSPPN